MSANLTFWDDDIQWRAAQLLPVGDVSRCWCDPAVFQDVVGVDFGSCEMHLYSAKTNRAWKVSADAAADAILGLHAGTLVIGEWAHLATPRTKKSLAQPFSEWELLALYSAALARSITVKLFPHYHSRRARALAAARLPHLQSPEKCDSADAMALALYVLHFNDISLANPPDSFSKDLKREYGKAVRNYSSVALNAERTSKYAGKYFPHVIDLGGEMHRERGKRIGVNACYSIASLIATELQGVPLIFVRNGLPPGVETWWRHVARMTPFHHKGGLARSNLMLHAFRPFLRNFGKRQGISMGKKNAVIPFGEHNDSQSLIRVRAMRDFRDIAKDCYRVGVNIAVKRGLEAIDPVHTPWEEVTNGR